MSHQTGIGASVDFSKIMGQAKNGNFRVVKVEIHNEKLEIVETKTVNSDFSNDYKKCITLDFVKNSCSYILIRSDEKSKNGQFMWIFILYTPDFSSVKDKMLYAATKASLKNLFGTCLILHEIHGTCYEDINYKGYEQYILSHNSPAPLTDAEIIYKEIKENETHIGLTKRAETLPGISFPIQESVLNAINEFKLGSKNYIELIVNVDKEIIELGKSINIKYKEISNFKCSDPRYHLIKFNYLHNKSQLSAIFFIYTMPGYSCSVKNRMMYSSCKAPFIKFFESKYCEIDKKLEENDLSTITEDFLYKELHPPEIEEKSLFQKPKRPGR